MKEILNAGLRVLTVMTLIAVLAGGCRQAGKKAQKDELAVDMSRDNAAIYEDLKKAEKIFYTLPSPLESAMIIKSTGAIFDEKLLNPVDNANKYITNRSMALNLGLYTCDLSYASLYDQTQHIINYMNAAKKMADGLGILDAISEDDINRLEENINNREVIMEIISQTFLNSNTYLEDNGQQAVAAMVLTGGWVEGLYISTKLVDDKNFKNNTLVERIAEQKLSIENLLSLLRKNQGHPAIDELLLQISKIKTVFDKISVETTPVETEYDQNTNVTLLKSKVTSNLTPQLFGELSAIVAEIRGTFVK
ncbi:MAG: hypothetical protein HPY62_03265 [Bacteroidales bacterium]|nr:hypothetical protein [Bacteroidales bacterium]